MKQKAHTARHLLQSDEWMRFQEALGKKTFTASGDGWSFRAILENSEPVLGKSSKRLYVPYGPFAQNNQSLKKALKTLVELSATCGANYIRTDPYPLFNKSTLKKLGLKKALRDSQPNMTWVLDITPSEDKLLMEMTSLNRRVWRRRDEFGLSFETDNSARGQSDFDKFMSATAKRTSSIFHDKEYISKLLEVFGKNADIVFCLHSKKRLAGALYIDDHETKTRYYMYAGSVDEAKQHNCSSALLNFLIFDAKNHGLKTFDFFGVSPSSATKHPWAGYSSFKRSFGGQDVELSGTWELPINKPLHLAVRLGRRVNKVIKR